MSASAGGRGRGVVGEAIHHFTGTIVMTMVRHMPTVSKSQLKGRMLAYFREVEASGEPLIVTDNGRPVLKVVPLEPPPRTVDEVFGHLRAGAWLAPDFDEPTADAWPQLRDDGPLDADDA